MPLFQECCVLIPANNLEDFPSQLSDSEAQSLLGAWTVLWHPSLLAEMEQIPAWYRADSPPDVLDNRLIAVPEPSGKQLPEGFRDRAMKNRNCHWFEASSREGFLEQFPWDRLPPLSAESLEVAPRNISASDFFAAAYATLQVQIMTKRLRYTSNLDELHLQNCAVNAAKAFVAGNGPAAAESLHDLFDCLAEERDHYFSSDPHLLDLVLTGPSTVNRLPALLSSLAASNNALIQNDHGKLESDDASSSASLEADEASEKPVGASLPTPCNLLVDTDAAAAIAKLPEQELDRFKETLSSGLLSWAGGGPGRNICFDSMTYTEAQAALCESHQKFVSLLGQAPPVYGRFSGSTPADLTANLVQLGYQGIMPIDFEGGTGFGDEAKVILQAAGVQLEALTAKPIDASSDSSFLTLGTRLGESIDRGEISTGLFVHWPGDTCQGFEDLRTVASWSLCLGKFWKLDEYFTEGEHPYHHGESVMVSPHSSKLLSDRVAEGATDPISSLSNAFFDAVTREQSDLLAGMSSLVSGSYQDPGENRTESGVESRSADKMKAATSFAEAIGVNFSGDPDMLNPSKPMSGDCLIVNPSSVGVRCDVSLSGQLAGQPKHLFASSRHKSVTQATVDLPACGFVRLATSDQKPAGGPSLGRRLRNSLFGGPKPIAEKDRLQNEFMEVSFSPKTGAVMGVYSGSRGNRFSLRLIAPVREKGVDVSMHADTFRVKESSSQQGSIEVTGALVATSDREKKKLAGFRLEYTLERGSRFLQVKGELVPENEQVGDPWVNYLGLRMAVASESAICRSIVRDKLHRVRSRRIVAPSGVVIDEAEKQTLVCGYGLPFHRRVGERFLDTLVLVQGESKQTFQVDYGIDVPSPVAACRARFQPPTTISVDRGSNGPEIGWICHLAPKEILLSALDVHRTSEGKLAAVVRVVQTQATTAKVKLRFCRDVVAVALVNDSVESLLAMDCESLNQRTESQSSGVKFEGDLVEFGVHSHGVVDLLVVFN